MRKLLLILLFSTVTLFAQDKDPTKSMDLFLEYWNLADMDEELEKGTAYTIFVPSDQGFKEVNTYIPNFLKQLKEPNERERLKRILRYHVVKGAHKVSDLQSGQKIMTADEFLIRVTKSGEQVIVNDALIVQPDVEYKMSGQDEGVIQLIDKVLIPPPRDDLDPMEKPAGNQG
ncbi:MAG: fasciclin domain-containing protein [Chlamydiia bacterium]|nr:fasciclin domain-containing protein [Chlamydiia bacterium]